MQFQILAFDAQDEGAYERRMKARPAHAEMIKSYKEKGHMILGAALLDDDGKMIGSSIVVDFPDHAAVEEWLNEEPYVLEDVWEEVNILPCQIAPTFAEFIPEK